MVRAISVVGRTRSSIKILNAAASSAHPPIAPGNAIRCCNRPSLPTVSLNRMTSELIRCFCAMVSLNTSAIRPSISFQYEGSLTLKSPSRNATMADRMVCKRPSAVSSFAPRTGVDFGLVTLLDTLLWVGLDGAGLAGLGLAGLGLAGLGFAGAVLLIALEPIFLLPRGGLGSFIVHLGNKDKDFFMSNILKRLQ